MQNSLSIQLPIIGYLRSPLTQKFGIPRQPNLVPIPSTIEFVSPYDIPSAFEGLESFSHIWLIWQCHHNHLNKQSQPNFKPQVRPPRLGGNEKLGVFATRSMYRPANIGLSVVQLENIENVQGKIRLHLLGADMVDGTPILDIKPYIGYSDRVNEAKSGFADAKPVQKTVIFSENFHQQWQILVSKSDLSENNFETDKITQQDLAIIQQLIAQDPRPAYRQFEISTIFTMRYKKLDVIFYMTETSILVIDKLVIITGY